MISFQSVNTISTNNIIIHNINNMAYNPIKRHSLQTAHYIRIKLQRLVVSYTKTHLVFWFLYNFLWTSLPAAVEILHKYIGVLYKVLLGLLLYKNIKILYNTDNLTASHAAVVVSYNTRCFDSCCYSHIQNSCCLYNKRPFVIS